MTGWLTLSPFDKEWEETTNACLRLLREAADSFAYGGQEREPLPSTVVAALIAVFAAWRAPSSGYDWKPAWPDRFFSVDRPSPPSVESLAILAAPVVRDDLSSFEAEMVSVVTTASASWTMGDPEKPETREVLRALLHILWSWRLVPRPPSTAYPQGV